MDIDTPESYASGGRGSNSAENVDSRRKASPDDGEGRHGAERDNSAKRRAHRKSRYGCKNCKKRRIKCDERKPECSNCRSRQVRCDYLSETSPISSQTSGFENTPSPTALPTAVNMSHAELMYHWTTSTSFTISSRNVGGTHWCRDVTEMALSHSHVLHLIFALTALHLAYCRPARREEYVAKADHHYTIALSTLSTNLSHINQENCDAILTSVQMVSFLAWARGPQPGEFLAFGDNGRSEWLTMFRGIRTTIETMGQPAFAKSYVPAIRAKVKPLALKNPPLAYQQPLTDLNDYIIYNSSPESLETNKHSFDVLLECYSNRYGGKDGEYHVVFAWLYRMGDAFLEALQRHDTVPLVVYAHFAVLMHDMEIFWYMKGWTAHVLEGIWNILRDEDRVYIRWACAVVGWIPPC
ncbi:hypothetical protein CC80DRAFT_433633 [Byssothecium circinans]|uniref:Zn(2)-C6 fungal-type domain-containing protein n=1 Tax=Byssothecium circinans TaxID=147558 RepID=A0A6A5UG64_9PLEO|nr:hypothetical protein CC80DRAFT_433633 [Byssothecium circinans]